MTNDFLLMPNSSRKLSPQMATQPRSDLEGSLACPGFAVLKQSHECDIQPAKLQLANIAQIRLVSAARAKAMVYARRTYTITCAMLGHYQACICLAMLCRNSDEGLLPRYILSSMHEHSLNKATRPSAVASCRIAQEQSCPVRLVSCYKIGLWNSPLLQFSSFSLDFL